MGKTKNSTTTKDGLRIIELRAANVKRLVAVEIRPDGNMVIVGGKNGAGKSSALDAISMAIGGKRLCPARPVRKGAKTAKIELDLGALHVTRTFTSAGGGGLKVENADGQKLTSPQSILDELVSSLTFDPLAFVNEHPVKQLEMLKSLVGLDFSAAEGKRAKLYEQRAAVNQEAKRLAALLKSQPEHPDTPDEEVSVAELIETLEESQKLNRLNEDRRKGAAERVQEAKAADDKLAEIRRQIVELKRAEEVLAKEAGEADAEAKRSLANTTHLQDVDLGPIHNALGTAEETNTHVRQNKARAENRTAHREAVRKSDKLTAAMDEIDTEKARSLEEAEFPVAGLAFDENGVTYRSIPFEQASSAEQLQVSIAMGIALNPKLKVLLIRDGSLLDEDSLALVAKMADEMGAQVWLERVATDETCSVILEDGHIQGEEPIEPERETTGDETETDSMAVNADPRDGEPDLFDEEE